MDVGEVIVKEQNGEGKMEWKSLEVDFVCNQGYRRCYIQSALSMDDEEKQKKELRPLCKINDSFAKYVVVGGMSAHYQNDDGIMMMNLYEFLKNPSI